MATIQNALAKSNKAAKNLTVGVTPVVGTHTMTTEVNGDTVQLFKVDENQVVLELTVKEEVLGVGVTTQYGDGVDTDRYIKSASAAAAGIKRITNEATAPYPYPSGGDTVDMLIGGANPTAGTKVHFTALVANVPTEAMS